MAHYKVKEIYYTLQGEGYHTGRPAVFLRFTGCNLWSGLEKDRSSAVCQFCDTDFFGTDGENGGKYKTSDLVEKVKSLWPANTPEKVFIVCTGGEPALQLDSELLDAFHQEQFEVAIETNGTVPLPQGIDWVCVSPKASAPLVISEADELKLVFPQKGIHPDDFVHFDAKNFYLQPMDSPELASNTELAIDYCKSHPKWKLSTQTHKFLHIP